MPRSRSVLETRSDGVGGVIRVDRIAEAFMAIPRYRKRQWPSDACEQLAALLRDNPRTRDVVYTRAHLMRMFYDVFTVPKSSDDAAAAVSAVAAGTLIPISSASASATVAAAAPAAPLPRDAPVSPRPRDAPVSPRCEVPKRHHAIDTAPYSKRLIDREVATKGPQRRGRPAAGAGSVGHVSVLERSMQERSTLERSTQERTFQEWTELMLSIGSDASAPAPVRAAATAAAAPLACPGTSASASSRAKARAKAATEADMSCCTRVLYHARSEIRAEYQGYVAPPPTPDDSESASAEGDGDAMAEEQGGRESRFSEYMREMLAKIDAEDKLRQLTDASSATAGAAVASTSASTNAPAAAAPAAAKAAAALPSIVSFMDVFGAIPQRCVACLCAGAQHVAAPCGHALYCDACKDSWFLQYMICCPVCNTKIARMLRVSA